MFVVVVRQRTTGPAPDRTLVIRWPGWSTKATMFRRSCRRRGEIEPAARCGRVKGQRRCQTGLAGETPCDRGHTRRRDDYDARVRRGRADEATVRGCPATGPRGRGRA